MAKKAETTGPLLTILFDGQRRHWRTRIALYKLEARRRAIDIVWHDFAETPEALDDLALDPAANRSSIYAVDGDGAVFSGPAALALLWSSLPSHRGLGYLLATPAASRFAELCGRFGRFAEARRPVPPKAA